MLQYCYGSIFKFKVRNEFKSHSDEVYTIQNYVKNLSVTYGSSVVFSGHSGSTNKTDRHDITEILLKVALNTIILKVRMWYIMFISDIGCVYLSRFIFVVSFQMKLLIEYMKLVLELLPGKRRRCHVTWPRNSMLIIKIKIITMN
jgi:hypothetical protein